MARIRTIKPEFPQSESMGRVSREARLCFMLLWTILDDEGRARGSSRMLASLLYPYDDDAPKLIECWLTELEEEGCVVRYLDGSDSYIASTNWLKHQKIDKPSKSRHPPIPDQSPRIVAKPREHSSPDLVPSILDLGPSIRTKDQKKDCAEPSQATALPVTIPAQRIFISIPTNRNGVEFNILDSAVEDYLATFPAVDVRQELREMRRWAIDNPTKRKTFQGMGRFINAWLGKEQDKGGARVNGHANGSRKNPMESLLNGAMMALEERDERAENFAGRPQQNGGSRQAQPSLLEARVDGRSAKTTLG